MPVHVYHEEGRVVVEVGGRRLELTEGEERLVLWKLAEVYGYRLTPVKSVSPAPDPG